MFRLAEDKEIQCLLRSSGVEPVREPPKASAAPEEQTEYRHHLTEEVRSALLQAGFKYIPHQLKLDRSLVPEVERVTGMKFACGCMACTDCESICLNFAEGVIAVLERDFIQLMHGERSYIFEQSSVRFLLTGITLGMLYVSVPAKSGLDELILAVLILMMSVDKWVRALELYGPVETTPQDPRPHRSLTIVKQKQQFAGIRARIKARRSLCTSSTMPPVTVRARAPVEVDRCAECKKPFDTDATLQECDCFAVTVRYREVLPDDTVGVGPMPVLAEKFPSAAAAAAVSMSDWRGRSFTV